MAEPTATPRRVFSTNRGEFRDSENINTKVLADALAILVKEVDSMSVSPDGRYGLFWSFIQKDDMQPEQFGHKPEDWDPAVWWRIYGQPFGAVN